MDCGLFYGFLGICIVIIAVLAIKLHLYKSQTVSRRIAVFSALSSDYDLICYINGKKNKVFPYMASKRFAEIAKDIDKNLPSNKKFDVLLKNIIHPDDLAEFLKDTNRENSSKLLAKKSSYTVHFRAKFGRDVLFYQLKLVKDPKKDECYVVGIRSIDYETRKEQENKKLREDLKASKIIANKDALTGVNSAAAFSARTTEMDSRIGAGQLMEFSVVMCDVNGLKSINDSQGHDAGNNYIRECCKAFCETFKQSPVFRIGGDEFAIILQGMDYATRNQKLQNLRQRALTYSFATGMADFDRNKDISVKTVLKRADSAMYKNKKEMKEHAG